MRFLKLFISASYCSSYITLPVVVQDKYSKSHASALPHEAIARLMRDMPIAHVHLSFPVHALLERAEARLAYLSFLARHRHDGREMEKALPAFYMAPADLTHFSRRRSANYRFDAIIAIAGRRKYFDSHLLQA